MAIHLDSVAEAANLLDEVRPGWHREIDIFTLDMTDGDACILGQLYGLADHGAKDLDLDDEYYFPGKPFGYGGNIHKEWVTEIAKRMFPG